MTNGYGRRWLDGLDGKVVVVGVFAIRQPGAMCRRILRPEIAQEGFRISAANPVGSSSTQFREDFQPKKLGFVFWARET